jgi:DNA ligase-associated metallophosphoesterase
MGCASLNVLCGDVKVQLRADRTIFIPSSCTLLLADVHLGKAQSLRSLGAPLSGDVQTSLLKEPLDRLARAVEETGATSVIVLGDLLHAPVGLTPTLIDFVTSWRPRLAVPLMLVPGNHDRRLDLVASQWGITILEDTHRLSGLLLVHDPAAVSTDASDFVVAGHVHPAINLPAGCGPRRAPVFAIAESMLLLPAFTTFAAGAPIRPADFVRLIAIADDELVPMTGPSRRPPRDIAP